MSPNLGVQDEEIGFQPVSSGNIVMNEQKNRMLKVMFIRRKGDSKEDPLNLVNVNFYFLFSGTPTKCKFPCKFHSEVNPNRFLIVNLLVNAVPYK